jgi:high-affinity Fe2+/Pb2+ permease
MNESPLRAFLVISAGAVVAGLLGWMLDKVSPKSKLRNALLGSLLTGACIYAALTLDSILPK